MESKMEKFFDFILNLGSSMVVAGLLTSDNESARYCGVVAVVFGLYTINYRIFKLAQKVDQKSNP
jgi:hypothetical protein